MKAPPKEKVGRGNGLGAAKLNEDTVRALREKREDGSFSIACAEATRRFGISKSTVYEVRSGKTWLHVK